MRQAEGRDPSTLAALTPVESREIHYRSFRTSLRLHGSHYMTLRRPSRVPESGREYVPGDPINLIDWKAYARTDQLIVREVRDESTARVLIGLDVSETMRWPVPGAPLPSPPPTKMEIAVRVAFNLAHMHLRMGDLVELWLVADGRQAAPDRRFAPRSPADLVSAFRRLAADDFALGAGLADFVPTPPPAGSPARPGRAAPRREVDQAFWVGDALSAADLGAFLGLGRRSMLMHVLSSLETDIGWVDGATSYFDEGQGRKEYQGQVLRHRDNYLKHLSGWRQKLKARQARRGGDYVTLTDATKVAAFHQCVAAFIKERA